LRAFTNAWRISRSRLDRIEKKLDDHETRIARLEERTSPIDDDE
jgi:hypothetical protein